MTIKALINQIEDFKKNLIKYNASLPMSIALSLREKECNHGMVNVPYPPIQGTSCKPLCDACVLEVIREIVDSRVNFSEVRVEINDAF